VVKTVLLRKNPLTTRTLTAGGLLLKKKLQSVSRLYKEVDWYGPVTAS
jgi:hypothetical protein